MINIIIKNVDKNKVSEIKELEDDEIVEEVEQKQEVLVHKEEDEDMSKEVDKPIVENEHSDYEALLRQIIKNQEILIKQNEVDEHHFKFGRAFNLIIFILIIVVALIWIFYGLDTLF
jgi:Fe2+ transport system protein B